MYSDILNFAEKMDQMYNIKRCEFCGMRAEDYELIDGLCEDCQDEINNDKLIGWRISE